MQNYGYVWGAILAVLIIIAAFFIFRAHQASAPSSVASSTPTISTSTPQIGGQMATSSNGQAQATGTVSGHVINPPALSDTVVIGANISADEATRLQNAEKPLISQLKAAPTRVDLWLKLGMYRKEAGDYAGAIAAWNYVAATGPTTINFMAYGDLGDLYQNFDTNYPKAEASYKAAIAIEPSYIDYYRDLFYLYGTENNPTAQKAILAQGLKTNPNNPDLLALQQQMQTK